MKDLTKYIGFGALGLGVLYFIRSSKDKEQVNIDGLDVQLNPEELINSGIGKLNISDDNKDKLKNIANNALGTYLANME